jgi:hypothetical protein
MQFEQTDIIGFLFFGRDITTLGPVDIVDGGNPYTPEFIFGLCGSEKEEKMARKRNQAGICFMSFSDSE